MARRRPAARNIAQCAPRPLVEHEVDEEEAVKLLVPRFRSRWLHWLQKRFKRPYVRVGLDEIGSAAWLLIDGRRTVLEIGAAMHQRFGERIEPVAERLGLFFGTLRRNRFIELDDASAASPSSGDKPIEPR